MKHAILGVGLFVFVPIFIICTAHLVMSVASVPWTQDMGQGFAFFGMFMGLASAIGAIVAGAE